MKQLSINEKQGISYCIPTALRDEQIRINLGKVKGRLTEPAEMRNEPLAIVCFAPSLNQTWKKLKKFKNIMTCSGAHKFLIDRGIIPNFHVDLDPRLHKIDILGEPHKDVEYLIASTIHPKYLDKLKDHKVKLWHIFADENEAANVLPRGEFLITGGSSVGLRCMTLARFMGFTDLHIFGMDGSFSNEATHTTEHPAAPKEFCEVVYSGKKYLTTPSVLHCAQETFRELDQMPDVKAQFYGDGLVQAMAKDYAPAPKDAVLAFNKPELISEEYRALNYQLHQDTPSFGMGGDKYADTVIKMKTAEIESILDYGAGKGMLQKALPFAIFQYDPAIPEISASPRPADLVISTDCLEHIEPDKLDFVLDDLKRVTKKVGYFVIHTQAAQKTYANGQNTHLIQQPAEWWTKQLGKYFDVATAQMKGKELHVVVSPLTRKLPEIMAVKGHGFKARFHTPNEICRWRAETLSTKEPITIDWISKIAKDDVLYDVGANVGGYTCWAGVQGIKVIAFEPEIENYAMLSKNILLNGIDAQAYCLAISDRHKLDTLHMSGRGLGGSCHSFGQAVDAHGNVRNGNHPEQPCVGMSIDELVEWGLPKPDHIKIDVDGFEPQVIKGATKTLRSVRSLLVEVNPALPEHLSMVTDLENMGFIYDKNQVESATRKEGNFKGVAEYVFYRQTETERHIAKAIEDAELVSEPFPHIYIENFLPDKEYADLMWNLPPASKYVPIKKVRGLRGYPKRSVGTYPRPEWMYCLRELLMAKFGVTGEVVDEHLLIRDQAGYQIGPHTDHPQRVMSAIMYLATDDKHPEMGTALYVPVHKGFKCAGGPHYDEKMFRQVKMAEYRPNSVFIFLKTDNSFHGVRKTTAPREVLLYDLRRVNNA